MPICTTCTTYVPYLYTVYESAYNLRLEQCQKCHTFADPYVEHDSLTLLLDLILLKRGVYRHLLFNRGSKPRRAINKPKARSEDSDVDHDTTARWIWTLKLGAGLIILDAFIRWTHLRPEPNRSDAFTEDSLFVFMRVLCGCLAETLAFHAGILLSSFILLKTIAILKRAASIILPSMTTVPYEAHQINLSLIPLTLFYSSLTKLFLLLLLTIWRPTLPSSHDGVQIQPGVFSSILSHPTTTLPYLLSELSKILDDEKIDREWVIRNILGGISAGFGLRVILDVHPFFSTFIIISGWLAKTFIAQLVGEWRGEKFHDWYFMDSNFIDL
ncbi:hypothetical protein AGABI1DRAFT_129784 [Agaricus bisporus var. burnettii JB137-S8]|uniref:Protein ARV n=1 Tax=Agaricus bisporus var. burnettii (strain JB137-S8 / ATCC MYA-4627 / FGSC 10392) TaxID=597362 RepID=K5X4Y2_AGABU|nr:uncharacterized protein AGABI1DRAFT_129784 [Agaricus bisporus var. burnettii JB137-S8]EKM78002.1 hypothetical protein AGABI1DRAFT_129784 [Agaricus bisporus var. burnettii JB137-S8]